MPALRISRASIVEPTMATPIAAKPQLSLATPHDLFAEFEFSEVNFASSFMNSTVLDEFSPLSAVPPMTSPLDYHPPSSSFSDYPSEPSASDNGLPSSSTNGGAAIKRRKSTGCAFEVDANGERRPKRGDEDYVKRPENAFILFRRKCVEEHAQTQQQQAGAGAGAAASVVDDAQPRAKKARQADLSKLISQQWRSLSAEDRAHWESLAKEKKREHELLHPDYVYRPQRAKRAVVRPSKKGKAIAEEDPEQLEAADGLSFVLPPPSSGPAPARRGRNRSHSMPGGYAGGQTVRVPAVPVPSLPSPTIPEIPISIARKFSLDPSRRVAEPPFDPAGVPRDVAATEQTVRFSHDSNAARPATQAPGLQLEVPAQPACAPELSPSNTSSPAQPFSSPYTPSLEQLQAWYQDSAGFNSLSPAHLPPPAMMYDASWPFDYLTELGQSELLSNGDFDVNAIVPASVDDHSLPQPCEWDFSSLPLIVDSSEGQDPFGLIFRPDSAVPYF